MGDRLRSGAVLILASLLLAVPGVASAEEFSSCWATREFDSLISEYKTVTRCRISGGTTVDYASDAVVPSRLYPSPGTDLTGQCWYYTSRVTQYLILSLHSGGAADIGYDPDPSTPGGLVAIGDTMPRCTSEPVPAPDPLAEVWDYVTSYIHAPPALELSPRVGEGVTGMDTYLGVPVPDPHSATLSSGLSTIALEIEMSAVHVDWGDGTFDTYPPHPEMLSGYPDGSAIHLYEIKDPDGVPLTVSYDWTVRWRQGGGAWQPLDAPDTTTTVIYPLVEIISVLTR